MSKKDSVAMIPKYRFPEFALDASIDYVAGGGIFDPITNRNHHADLPILAITQEYGAIPRDEIDYKVSVTKKSLKAYKIVEKGDFIISLRSFQGGIEYSMYDGICSPAYIILRKKTNIIDQYYKYYFKSHRFIQDLNKDLEGIRDGKMISYGQFSSILLPKPDEEEQQKIADCLSSIDNLISAEEKKLLLLNDYKKGWMQKLFPTEGKTVPEFRFPEFRNSGDWEEKELSSSLNYLQPTPYLVQSENYDDKYKIPVLTAGKSFILGHTNEKEGIFNKKIPVIIFDDFTTASKFVNFPFKVKSSAMKILLAKNSTNIKFVFEVMQMINYDVSVHQRHWISVFSKLKVPIPEPKEQQKIADFLSGIDELISRQKDKIEELKQHKKALMQGLFPAVEEVWK